MSHVDKNGVTNSHLVLFSGPHGSSLPITEYGEVVLKVDATSAQPLLKDILDRDNKDDDCVSATRIRSESTNL